MVNSGNKTYIASKNILKDFNVGALKPSASSLFQYGIARALNASWRWRMQLSPVIMSAMPQMNTIYKRNTETPLLTQSDAMLRRGKVLSCRNQHNILISQEKGMCCLFIKLQHLKINLAFAIHALFV